MSLRKSSGVFSESLPAFARKLLIAVAHFSKTGLLVIPCSRVMCSKAACPGSLCLKLSMSPERKSWLATLTVSEEHLVSPATTLPSITMRNLNLRNGSCDEALGAICVSFLFLDHPLPSFVAQSDTLNPHPAGAGIQLRQGCVLRNPATVQLVAGDWCAPGVVDVSLEVVESTCSCTTALAHSSNALSMLSPFSRTTSSYLTAPGLFRGDKRSPACLSSFGFTVLVKAETLVIPATVAVPNRTRNL